MGRRDDRDLPPESTGPQPSFVDELRSHDPWQEMTPAESAPAPLSIDAEFAVPAGAGASGSAADDQGLTEFGEAWTEAGEVLDGDGPFPVAIDAPRPTKPTSGHAARDLMIEAFGRPSAERPGLVRPGVPLAGVPRSFSIGPSAPAADAAADASVRAHVLQRRVGPEAPRGARGERRAERPGSPDRPSGRPRRYPKMLALLKDREGARRPGSVAVDSPPPVPGTFFPAPREPMEQPEPTDLDRMLATMAEGLLIGETAEGHTEVRVTLKDEFFAGTELRIVSGHGRVRAVLAPPDRDVYWQLNARLDDLKDRLGGRGLEVEAVELLDP